MNLNPLLFQLQLKCEPKHLDLLSIKNSSDTLQLSRKIPNSKIRWTFSCHSVEASFTAGAPSLALGERKDCIGFRVAIELESMSPRLRHRHWCWFHTLLSFISLSKGVLLSCFALAFKLTQQFPPDIPTPSHRTLVTANSLALREQAKSYEAAPIFSYCRPAA